MRLTEKEVAAIKAAALEAFGDTAVVRLFGSRVHDDLRGGDIDLHIECADSRLSGRSGFLPRLHRVIGERAIDVLVHRRGDQLGKFDCAAIRSGIVL